MQTLLIIAWLLLCSMCQFSWAAEDSVEGIWTTFDEESGKADSLVKIWVEQGELKGKIIKLIEPDEENPKCTECEGAFKDMPILGLQFIWGLTKEDGVWDDGNILDPGTGSIYTSKIEVIESGKKLDVRGYIGFAFAGRSTVWERADEELIKAP